MSVEKKETLIQVQNLTKTFGGSVHALNGVSTDIKKGEVVCVIGPSGSGKSTLLRCATGLETPDSGEIIKQGDVGLVFQNFNLFPHFSVLKNITDAPIRVQKRKKEEVYAQARTLLKQMGLADRENAYPFQLSGGQQQRVSIARALVRNPAVILADEPTGALDSHTGREVLGMLQQMHDEGHTVVLITHDNSIAVQADRIIRLEDGRVVYDGDAHAPEAVVQPTLLPETPDEEEKA